MSSIHDLPNEFLCIVFREISISFSRQSPRVPFEATRACSHVCSKWRVIILKTTALWAPLVDYSLSDNWITTILSRAGPTRKLELVIPSFTPLYLHYLKTSATRQELNRILGPAPNPLDVFEPDLIDKMRYPGRPTIADSSKVLDPLPLDKTVFNRCHTLVLVLSPIKWIFYSKLIEKYIPLPRIKNITLACTPGSDHLVAALKFGVKASQQWEVKTFRLRGFLPPLHIPVFKLLEHLTISNCPRLRKMTVPDWLQILNNMPLLRYLDLDDSIRNLSVQHPEPLNITLQYLENFIFQSTVADGVLLLTSIEYPKACRIRAVLSMSLGMDDAFAGLCAHLEKLPPTWPLKEYDAISIAVCYEYCRVIVGTHNRIDAFRSTQFDLTLLYPRESETNRRLFTPIEPLVKLLNLLKTACMKVSLVVLPDVSVLDFPADVVHSLFTTATTLLLPVITSTLRYLLVSRVVLQQRVVVRSCDKENADPNPGTKRVFLPEKLFPCLEAINYVTCSTDFSPTVFNKIGILPHHIQLADQ